MTEMKLTKKEAWPVVSQVFPEYRGRKFSLRFTTRVTFSDTNWGGGTRNEYRTVRADGTHGYLSVPAPWANMVEGQTVDLPMTALLIEHAIFCGRDLGIRIYAHPAHMPKWLPAGK